MRVSYWIKNDVHVNIHVHIVVKMCIVKVHVLVTFKWIIFKTSTTCKCLYYDKLAVRYVKPYYKRLIIA